MRRQVQKALFLSLFLTLSLALSLVPTAFAADSVSIKFCDNNGPQKEIDTLYFSIGDKQHAGQNPRWLTAHFTGMESEDIDKMYADYSTKWTVVGDTSVVALSSRRTEPDGTPAKLSQEIEDRKSVV